MKQLLLTALLTINMAIGFGQINIDSLHTSFLTTKTDTVTLRKYLQRLEKLSSENINEIEITANWIIENAVLKKNDNMLAAALVILGDTYLNAQKLKEAAEVYLRVITLTENSSNYIDLSKAYIGMYNFNKQSGDYDKAMAFITKCLTVSEKNNYKPGIAKSKYGTAALLDDQSYPEKKDTFNLTFKLMNEAAALWAEVKDTAQVNRMQVGMAEALSNYGLYDTAIQLLKSKKLFLADSYNQKYAAQYYFTLGKIYNQKAGASNEKKEIHLKAIENFDSCISIAKKLNNNKYLLWGYNWISSSYAFINDYKNAYLFKKRFANLNDSLLDASYLQSMAGVQHKYEVEKKEKEIISLHSANLQKSTLNKFLIGSTIALVLLGLLGYRNFKTKQKLHKTQIIQLEKDKQLLAIDAMLKGQEEERSRLAKDLHDGLGGMLSGVKLSFVNMKENLIMDAESVTSFEKSILQLDNTIAELRKVAHNLMPEALVKFGLKNAILDFCNSMQLSSKTKIIFEQLGTERLLSNTADLYIYRIVQELINNAIKHADADQILVQLTKTNDKVLLTVEDDGKGFNTELIRSAKGIGLKNIQQRVDYLKGKIDIASQAAEGTSVNIELYV
ncbi:MAG: hypothetical protein IPN43_06400 [Chitinophagaceae bacterium]|nr:hypothetical protein [Chitinophagaceae bacterium]